MSYFCAYEIRLDGEAYVYARYYDTEFVDGVTGVSVDILPIPLKNGKDPVLKVHLLEKTLYYDYLDPVIPVDPLPAKIIELESRLDQAEKEQANLLLSLVERGVL